MDEFSVGSAIMTDRGRFVIVREIARGSGTVAYLAEAAGSALLPDGTPVSVKVFMPQAGVSVSETARVINLRRAASEKCVNIARVMDVVVSGDRVLCISEWVVGDSLESVVGSKGPLDQRAMADVMLPIIGAVGVLHSFGLTDNLISPADIILTTSADGRRRPVLVDLGESASVGYMSIEKCARSQKLTEASDIYSLGATIFFALTGLRPPMAAELSETALRGILGPGVSDAVKQVVVTAMSLRPDGRQASTVELSGQLSAALGRQMEPPMVRPVTSAPRVVTSAAPRMVSTAPPVAPVAPPMAPTARPVRGTRSGSGAIYVLIGVLAALAIALGVLAYIFLIRDNGGNGDRDADYELSDFESDGYRGSESEPGRISRLAKRSLGSDRGSRSSDDRRRSDDSDASGSSSFTSDRGSYDMAFHQLVPGSNVRSLTVNGQTFNFNRSGEWTNQDYVDTLHDRYWDFDGPRRSSESYTTSDGTRGTMYYRWDGSNLVELSDPMRGFTVVRSYDGAGHCTESVTNYYDGRPSSAYSYYNYKTDSHGNWISRKNSRGGTETRRITYWD